jgi:hypothetical protein
MKFTSEQVAFIRYTQNRIKNLENQQSELYSELLEKVNVSEQAEEWLFDYVYNNYGSIKNIEAKNSSKS